MCSIRTLWLWLSHNPHISRSETKSTLACFTKCAKCMTLSVLKTCLHWSRHLSFRHFCLKLVCRAKRNQGLQMHTRHLNVISFSKLLKVVFHKFSRNYKIFRIQFLVNFIFKITKYSILPILQNSIRQKSNVFLHVVVSEWWHF